MDDRTNTIAGWALAGGIAALGLSIVSGMVFKSERPEKMGYPIEGVEAADEGGGGAAVLPIAARLAVADAAKGADQFKKCTACHTITEGGATGLGPNLWGALGKPHGYVAGFAYSNALKDIPGNWDFEGLDAWLASPRRYAPGTKMTFAGIANAQDRANLILWMNQQGSSLPLPPPPAADAAPAEPDAAEPANISNEAALAPGAPSVDPNAAIQAEKKGH